MDDAEANYVIDAVHFLAREGHMFLSLYDFDLETGTWSHRYGAGELQRFSLDAALSLDEGEPATLGLALREQLYRHYLAEAERLAGQLHTEPEAKRRLLSGKLADLQFFSMPDDERQPH
jgi:hypothetical protein